MKTSRNLFLMAVLFFVGIQAEAKKVKLQYKFQPGQEFKLESSANMDVAQEFMGNVQTTTTLNASTYLVKVVGLEPSGDYRMEISICAFAMTSLGANGDLKYDSATDSVVPDYAKAMVAAMNQVFKVTMSPLGKINECIAPEGLAAKISKMADELGGGQMKSVAEAAGAEFTSDGFRIKLGNMFLVFPDGGVEQNEPWMIETKFHQMAAFNATIKYELTDATKEVNSFKVSGTIVQDPDSPPMEMQGMTITYELLGGNEGTLQLDASTGLLIASEKVTSISGTVAVDSPQLASPMSIPVTVRSVEKVSRK
jgi:hypothetical protein